MELKAGKACSSNHFAAQEPINSRLVELLTTKESFNRGAAPPRPGTSTLRHPECHRQTIARRIGWQQRGPLNEPAAVDEAAAARKPRGWESGSRESSGEAATSGPRRPTGWCWRHDNAGEEGIAGVPAASPPRKGEDEQQTPSKQ